MWLHHVGPGYGRRTGKLPDMGGSGAATPPHDVHIAVPEIITDLSAHALRSFVITPELVGQPGIGVGTHIKGGLPGKLLKVRFQFGCPQGTVEADRQQLHMGQGVQKSLQGLSGKGTPAGIGDGPRHHQGEIPAPGFQGFLDGHQCRLGIQRVKNGLHQQQFSPPVEEPFDLYTVGRLHLIEGDRPETRIIDIGRKRKRFVGGPDGPRHITGFGGIGRREFVSQHPGNFCRCLVHGMYPPLCLIVGLRNRVGIEGVGRKNICPRFQILPVYRGNDLRLRERKNIVVPLQVEHMGGKQLSPEILLGQMKILDQRSHGPIEHQHAMPQFFMYIFLDHLHLLNNPGSLFSTSCLQPSFSIHSVRYADSLFPGWQSFLLYPGLIRSDPFRV